MSSPCAPAAPSPSPSPPPPALVLVPPTPPPSIPLPPPSPAPSSFTRRGRSSHRVPRVPPPPLPLVLPLELGAAHILEMYLSSPSSSPPPPPSATAATAPRLRNPPRLRLPFTSLLLADNDAPASPLLAEKSEPRQQSKKQKKPARSRSTPARARIPVGWRAKKDSEAKAAPRSKEVEYIQVDAKLEWAMEALGC
ncbi:hypothetical protein JCM10450v2_000271 [Rhodotorula kratochvilovae]